MSQRVNHSGKSWYLCDFFCCFGGVIFVFFSSLLVSLAYTRAVCVCSCWFLMLFAHLTWCTCNINWNSAQHRAHIELSNHRTNAFLIWNKSCFFFRMLCKLAHKHTHTNQREERPERKTSSKYCKWKWKEKKLSRISYAVQRDQARHRIQIVNVFSSINRLPIGQVAAPLYHQKKLRTASAYKQSLIFSLCMCVFLKKIQTRYSIETNSVGEKVSWENDWTQIFFEIPVGDFFWLCDHKPCTKVIIINVSIFRNMIAMQLACSSKYSSEFFLFLISHFHREDWMQKWCPEKKWQALPIVRTNR